MHVLVRGLAGVGIGFWLAKTLKNLNNLKFIYVSELLLKLRSHIKEGTWIPLDPEYARYYVIKHANCG